ncbi:ArsR/SmtB family transcription factor [Variovorax sp. ZT4R33]|uniref:ArsR/SmtB family transcription factor n=1 Tax=Variovorax sp. ZT4R33 TaxID=3443743 RepID=UPI003F44A5AC
MDAVANLADPADDRLARIAGAMAEPARARMLCCLMDGHARTATELASVAGVAASTASAHLARLRDERLVESVAQGKHRYFRLTGDEVGTALESLLVLAGAGGERFRPNTPHRLRAARTCYDHIAGAAGVAMHDHLHAQGWLVPDGAAGYALTPHGAGGFAALGIDVGAARSLRRRFACPCLDWSERRPHLGGALGAALLAQSVRRGWVQQDLDSRALAVTPKALREVPGLFAKTDAVP